MVDKSPAGVWVEVVGEGTGETLPLLLLPAPFILVEILQILVTCLMLQGPYQEEEMHQREKYWHSLVWFKKINTTNSSQNLWINKLCKSWSHKTIKNNSYNKHIMAMVRLTPTGFEVSLQHKTRMVIYDQMAMFCTIKPSVVKGLSVTQGMGRFCPDTYFFW